MFFIVWVIVSLVERFFPRLIVVKIYDMNRVCQGNDKDHWRYDS